jgi:hypothetical protein
MPKFNLKKTLPEAGGIIAGSFLGKKVATMLPASLPTFTAPAVNTVVGIMLLNSKNSMMRGAGAGLIAAGGDGLLAAAGINGYDYMPLPEQNYITPVNGTDSPSPLNGLDNAMATPDGL